MMEEMVIYSPEIQQSKEKIKKRISIVTYKIKLESFNPPVEKKSNMINIKFRGIK